MLCGYAKAIVSVAFGAAAQLIVGRIETLEIGEGLLQKLMRQESIEGEAPARPVKKGYAEARFKDGQMAFASGLLEFACCHELNDVPIVSGRSLNSKRTVRAGEKQTVID